MRTAAQNDAVNRIVAARPGDVFAWIEPLGHGVNAMELSTSEAEVFIIECDGRITDREGREVTL